MAWDFSTEPEFQKKLDWVDEFCREEVEPLEYVFPYAVRSPDPEVKALVPVGAPVSEVPSGHHGWTEPGADPGSGPAPRPAAPGRPRPRTTGTPRAPPGGRGP